MQRVVIGDETYVSSGGEEHVGGDVLHSEREKEGLNGWWVLLV